MLLRSSFERNIIAPPHTFGGRSSGALKPLAAISRHSIARYGAHVVSPLRTYSKA